MKHQSGKYVIGYVTVIIKGKHPEQLLQSFMEGGYPVWDITYENQTTYRASIYRHHLEILNKLASKSDMTIITEKEKGGGTVFLALLKRKELFIALFISAIVLFVLANTAWKVEIKGVSVHIEERIEQKLLEHGLYSGAWIYQLESLDRIQEQMLHEIPELLYIGIQKNGTSYVIEAIEKKTEKQQTEQTARQLIAKKDGIIQKMFIKSGVPVVEINDFVKKGDILVTNEVKTKENEEDEEDAESVNIAVDGKVFANTWYNVDVVASLKPANDKLTGEKTTRYQLQLNERLMPIWGFGAPPYKQNVINEDTKPLHLWKWKLPVEIVQQNIFEYDSHALERSVEETKELAVQHVKENLKTTLGQDIEIVKYYVLHETEENGKVKMNIYISILENIATAK